MTINDFIDEVAGLPALRIDDDGAIVSGPRGGWVVASVARAVTGKRPRDPKAAARVLGMREASINDITDALYNATSFIQDAARALRVKRLRNRLLRAADLKEMRTEAPAEPMAVAA